MFKIGKRSKGTEKIVSERKKMREDPSDRKTSKASANMSGALIRRI